MSGLRRKSRAPGRRQGARISARTESREGEKDEGGVEGTSEMRRASSSAVGKGGGKALMGEEDIARAGWW